MQFTEKFIQTQKPKSKRYDVREKSGEGFAIRVFPSGETSWIFFYTFIGKKRRMTLGSYPSMSLAAARKNHRKALKVLEDGNDPALVKRNELIEAIHSSTVANLIDEYIEKWAKPRKRSWMEDKRILDVDVKPQWGKRKAKDITKRDVLLLLDNIKDRGAPIAANRTLACVRRMFNFGIERDILTTTPCLTVKLPSKENKCERCLSVKEILNFWKGLDAPDIIEINPDKSKNIIHEIKMSTATKLALKFQFVTAQRKGEVTNAEWSEIDLKHNGGLSPLKKPRTATHTAYFYHP